MEGRQDLNYDFQQCPTLEFAYRDFQTTKLQPTQQIAFYEIQWHP